MICWRTPISPTSPAQNAVRKAQEMGKVKRRLELTRFRLTIAADEFLVHTHLFWLFLLIYNLWQLLLACTLDWLRNKSISNRWIWIWIGIGRSQSCYNLRLERLLGYWKRTGLNRNRHLNLKPRLRRMRDRLHLFGSLWSGYSYSHGNRLAGKITGFLGSVVVPSSVAPSHPLFLVGSLTKSKPKKRYEEN